MKTQLLLAVLVCLTPSCFGQAAPVDVSSMGWSFVPDAKVKSLDGSTKLGAAEWSARDGEIAASGKSGVGWLLLDHSFQDVGIHTLFKSTGGEIGFAFRLEKTAEGTKGVMVSIKDDQVASYRITIDPQGKETFREQLRYAGSIIRLAPPATGNNAGSRRGGGGGQRRGGGGGGRGGARGNSPSPLARVSTAIRPGEWNQIEIFLDLNIIRSFVNDGGETAGGAADETYGKFGPIALYVGEGAEAHFKDFGYQDVAKRTLVAEKHSDNFRVQRINDMYYSWGCGAADFDKDGNIDIVAGPFIYYGPDFTRFREIFAANPFNPSREFTDINCQYTYDFNGDGWPDVLTGPPKATLYLNPKGESRRWDKFEVISSIQTEITIFRDLDGSGVPALIYGADGELRYAKPDPANPTKPWVGHAISERGLSMPHGLGVGDINGDGKLDVINPNGWWEQPKDGPDKGPWKYHPEAFGRYGHRAAGAGGAVMAVYDVNGDGLNDVVCALNAHGFGLAWFEQKRDASGRISFERHMVADDYSAQNAGGVTFSEPHGSTFADIDGDGIPDFIVGKRYFSHLDDFFDPDPYGPPVLYVYHTVRDPKAPGRARFVPELIHNRSGAGSDVLAVDLNKDGKIDIVSSTDRGTFIFWNTAGKGKSSAQKK